MIPEHWPLDRVIRHCFAEIITNQILEHREREKLMATLEETLAAVNDLSAKVDAFVASHQSTEAADLDQVKAAVEAVAAKLQG